MLCGWTSSDEGARVECVFYIIDLKVTTKTKWYFIINMQVEVGFGASACWHRKPAKNLPILSSIDYIHISKNVFLQRNFIGNLELTWDPSPIQSNPIRSPNLLETSHPKSKWANCTTKLVHLPVSIPCLLLICSHKTSVF